MTVKGNNLRRLFPWSSEERGAIFYQQRRFLRPLILSVSLCLCFLALAFFYRMGWVFFLSLSSFLLVLYLKTSQIAYQLRFRRHVPLQALKDEALKVRFEIRNESWFAFNFLTLTDNFTGNREQRMNLAFTDQFGSMEERTLEYTWKADVGIGKQTMGPCQFEVWDPLGIFCFRMSDEQTHEIEIFPLHRELPQLPIRGSDTVFTYGEQQIPTSGTSTLFAGVREYRAGDAFRHIAWKMTAKHGRLMVKEFDRCVNSNLTLLLDLSLNKQVQVRGESTWEYLKELACNLAVEQAGHSNSVQLIAGQKHIPFGAGPTHLGLLTQTIARLEPTEREEPIQENSKFIASLRADSVLLFLSPVYLNNFDQTANDLLAAHARGVQVFCFLVEAGSFLDLALLDRLGVFPSRNTRISKIAGIDRIKNAGIPVFLLEKGSDLSQSLSQLNWVNAA